MKITRRQLRKIIKEEYRRVLAENAPIRIWSQMYDIIDEEIADNLETQLEFFANSDGIYDKDVYVARATDWIQNIWGAPQGQKVEDPRVIEFALKQIDSFWEDEGGFDDDGYYY
tara:strand:- start:15 stop:356 length:342 start_codon:yes stop_codon:yes gene_type:complete